MFTAVEWLGHDGFRLRAGVTVYVDPWRIAGGDPADLIMITHEHFDHCAPDDVRRLLGRNTNILGNAASIKLLKEAGVEAEMRVVKAGDELEAAGVPVEVLPAYNTSKFRSPGVPFHPKEAGHVGYVFTVGDKRIYHTGDSDMVPEMRAVVCDILLVPVSGTYVMTADEAAEASRVVDPSGFSVPMHYGEIVGTEADALRFKELVGAEKVRILSRTV